MAQAWFVSDIHIENMKDEKAGMFLAFLSSLGRDRPCSHLFLVGDVFDLWVGDHKYFIERFQPILNEIKRIIDDNIEVHYFEGNHDLHLGKYFGDILEAKVHQGPKYFLLDDETFRVEHGDQADPEDLGYRFLRWFLRTPLLKALSYNLPGSVVSAIGQRASAKSRTYTTHSKTIDEDSARKKLHQHAENAYAENPFDFLINGHVHIRDDYKTDQFQAINLGTWLKEPGALEFTDKKLIWVSLMA